MVRCILDNDEKRPSMWSFGSSFLMIIVILVSGTSSRGLIGPPDQQSNGCDKKLGPLHHNEESFNADADNPRDPRSAGFPEPATWFHVAVGTS